VSALLGIVPVFDSQLEAREIEKSFAVPNMVRKRSHGQEEKWNMVNVYRLYRPKQELPEG
jgi:hypothetical protein